MAPKGLQPNTWWIQHQEDLTIKNDGETGENWGLNTGCNEII
jgi:hypothetical protein